MSPDLSVYHVKCHAVCHVLVMCHVTCDVPCDGPTGGVLWHPGRQQLGRRGGGGLFEPSHHKALYQSGLVLVGDVLDRVM